jgi:hypothetical protein
MGALRRSGSGRLTAISTLLDEVRWASAGRLTAYRPICTRCYNRRMKTDDLYDFLLIGAGVLIVCVLFAHGPFIHKPRHPILFGILSAIFIMTIYFLAHLL